MYGQFEFNFAEAFNYDHCVMQNLLTAFYDRAVGVRYLILYFIVYIIVLCRRCCPYHSILYSVHDSTMVPLPLPSSFYLQPLPIPPPKNIWAHIWKLSWFCEHLRHCALQSSYLSVVLSQFTKSHMYVLQWPFVLLNMRCLLNAVPVVLCQYT